MENGKEYTTKEALERLHMSPATFWSRVHELDLLPINYNPNLKRQRRSYWSELQIERIGRHAEEQRKAFRVAS